VLDGWIPEFARHGENSFVLPVVDTSLPDHEQDDADYENLMRILEKEVIPTYYQDQPKWMAIMKQSMQDVVPQFDSDRMAREYYEIMYS
jgi:starch phosphorylase